MSDHFISSESAEGDLLAGAAFVGERIRSSSGRGEAMNAIIPRYLSRDDVDLAAELANAIDEPFARDKLLLLVAEKCAVLDDVDYGKQLAEAIDDHGIQAQAFERIAIVQAGKGEIASAREIAESMSHPDFVLAAIAAKQAAEGDEAASKAVLDEIVFPSARVASLLQIAGAKINEQDLTGAQKWLDLALSAADDIEHTEEKIRDLCDIGNLFIGAGNNEKAIAAFERAKGFAERLDNTHRDFLLVNCALGLLYSGSDELADNALDLVRDKTQMASALLGFSREYWKRQEKENAVDTLDEAYEILKSQRDAETRDSRARNSLLATIGAQFAGYGKTDRGVEIALENTDPKQRTAALSQIAQALVVQKEDDLARQTINLIDDDADRLFALLAASDVKRDLEDGREASIALLAEAAELSETVQQLGARS